jgi:flagellar hook assembly protein FlgD
VDFSSDSLHPSITGVSPGAFSPNGDKIKDTTTVSFGLPDTETVVLRIVNSSGTIMRGPLSFGTLAAGAHAWIWNGKTNSGHVVPTATYTLKLDTSKVVNGVTVRGAVSRAVGVDVTPPVMSSVTGVGATFYPYPDGYHDTFVPAVTLNEASVLTLVVRNPHGTVRSITVHKPSGRTSVSWNGRDRANRMVAAGTYQWYLKAVDGLANSRTGGVHSLHVSGKRLVAKSAVITENGSSYTSTGAVLGYCSGYSTTRSDFYPYGIWLETECSPAADGFEIVAANYHFRLPAATSYGTMRMQAYGNTVSPPSEIVAGFQRPASNTWDWPGYAKVSSGANHWYSIGSVAAAGHYPSSHVAVIAVGVDNYYGAPSDFDIRYVRLTLSYKVLQ